VGDRRAHQPGARTASAPARFFAGSTIVSTFDEPLQPLGERILEQAPVPA